MSDYEPEPEQRCIKHAGYEPGGDCVYCEYEIERERARAAEARMVELRWKLSKSRAREAKLRKALKADAERVPVKRKHRHRFLTDEDGCVHPCVCGKPWSRAGGA
jgi:hypothetical protein